MLIFVKEGHSDQVLWQVNLLLIFANEETYRTIFVAVTWCIDDVEIVRIYANLSYESDPENMAKCQLHH